MPVATSSQKQTIIALLSTASTLDCSSTVAPPSPSQRVEESIIKKLLQLSQEVQFDQAESRPPAHLPALVITPVAYVPTSNAMLPLSSLDSRVMGASTGVGATVAPSWKPEVNAISTCRTTWSQIIGIFSSTIFTRCQLMLLRFRIEQRFDGFDFDFLHAFLNMNASIERHACRPGILLSPI